MMDFQYGKFASFDGTRLFYRFAKHPSSKDLLVVLHGHGEHSGRYEKFLSHLSGENISLALFDLRGHGQSEGPHVYVDDFSAYLADVSAFIDFLAAKHQTERRVYLLGHSVGGLVAVHWALAHAEQVKALILSAPCMGLKIPGALAVGNRFLNQFAPKFLYQNPVYPPFLTHDPEEVRKYKSDPYIRRKISVRLVNEMLLYVARLEDMDAVITPFPVYLMLADLERVVDSERAKAFFEKVSAPEKKLRIFSGFYHEIFNEVGQAEVFQVLRDFLRSGRSFSH